MARRTFTNMGGACRLPAQVPALTAGAYRVRVRMGNAVCFRGALKRVATTGSRSGTPRFMIRKRRSAGNPAEYAGADDAERGAARKETLHPRCLPRSHRYPQPPVLTLRNLSVKTYSISGRTYRLYAIDPAFCL
jgi:hypothetical protein